MTRALPLIAFGKDQKRSVVAPFLDHSITLVLDIIQQNNFQAELLTPFLRDEKTH